MKKDNLKESKNGNTYLLEKPKDLVNWEIPD